MGKIFLTGATGFIGKRLLPKLAEENEVVILVREPSIEKAKDWINKKRLKNIKIVAGDLEKERLGISDTDVDEIFNNLDYIFHLAAFYDPSLSSRRVFEISLEGTKRLVLLAQRVKNLKAFVHVSTAYCVGLREGVILEDRLIKPKGFRNAYEEAKFKTEIFLKKKENFPLVVIRPTVVVGESKTGEFDKGVKSGVYLLIKAIDRGLFFFYPGNCQGIIAAVPVDWVAETVAKIGLDKRSLGKTFHLVDSDPMTTKRFINQVAELLAKRKPVLVIPKALLKLVPLRRLRNQLLMLNQRQVFDMTNTREIIGEENLAPSLSSYLPTLIKYYVKYLR